MARALLNVPPLLRGRGHHDPRADRASDGNRLPAGRRWQALPRDIIRRFTCRYDGEAVFSAELSPAIAANPFLAFNTVATEAAPSRCTWEGDKGFSQTEEEPSCRDMSPPRVDATALPRSILGRVRTTVPGRRPPADDMAARIPAMRGGGERDDRQNPGMLWVGDGESLWRLKPAAGGRPVPDCHGDAAQAMRGVAAGYPKDSSSRPAAW